MVLSKTRPSAEKTSDRASHRYEIANAIADANLSSRGLGSGLAGVRERLTAWNDGSGAMTVDRRPDRFVVRIDMPHVDGSLAS